MRFSSKRAIAHTDCPTIPVESGNNKSRVTPHIPCHGRNSHLAGSIQVKAITKSMGVCTENDPTEERETIY